MSVWQSGLHQVGAELSCWRSRPPPAYSALRVATPVPNLT